MFPHIIGALTGIAMVTVRERVSLVRYVDGSTFKVPSHHFWALNADDVDAFHVASIVSDLYAANAT